MEYASLIAEFGERYEMGRLEPDADGVVGFEVDGRLLVLQRLEASNLVLATFDLGEAPAEGADKLNALLMQSNQALYALDGMAIAYHNETGRYRLLFRIDVSTLDFIGFDEKIARLLDRAERWGDLLEKITPLLSLAANANAAGSEADSGVPFELPAIANLMRV